MKPAVAPSKEFTHLANVERQKKDGIIPPAPKFRTGRTQEEIVATQNARPSQAVSLTLLDLSHPPSEADLIRAGSGLAPLSPTASADSSIINDHSAKAKQEQDNLLFGRAINAWNQHQLPAAMDLFIEHLKFYPDSPWAAESRLHLAMSSLQQHLYADCYQQVDSVLKMATKGTAVYQKALLLKAQALAGEGHMEEAAATYSAALSSETDAWRRSMASSWLLALSQQKKNRS